MIEYRAFAAGDIGKIELQSSQVEWETFPMEAQEAFEEWGSVITAFEGDRVLGVGGVLFHPEKPPMVMCLLSDEVKVRYREIYRMCRIYMRKITRVGRVTAHTDVGDEPQARWLRHFGMKRVGAEKFCGRAMVVWENSP